LYLLIFIMGQKAEQEILHQVKCLKVLENLN